MILRHLPAVSLCLLAALLPTCAADDKKAPTSPPPAKPVKPAPQKPRDAETAMKEFKAEIAAIRSSGEKQDKEAGKGNPAARMRMMKTATARLAAVQTDGLPDDLRKAYDGMAKFWKATNGIYDDMPAEDAAVEAWAKKKFSDPKVEEKYKPIMAEGRVAGAELMKATQKYGIQIELPGK